AIEAHAVLERQSRVDAPAILAEERELGTADLLSRAVAEHGALRQRSVETADVEDAARAEAVEARPLQIAAGLEHVLPVPVARDAERLDPLQALNRPLLIVEEAAALGLRCVDHRRLAVGVHVDLEPAAGDRRLQ